MDVDLFERRRVKDFSIGNTIEGHAACEAYRLEFRAFSKLLQHAEINLFEARLQRSSQISVTLLQRLLWSTNRTKTPCQFSRKHCAEHRRFVRFRPGHFRACAMVRKVIQPQPESVSVRTRIKAHDVAESFELFRLPVSGEPHDFVLVAKFQKAKILRYGCVKKPERMRKGHRSADEHAMALAHAPHGAGEIAESVRGQQRSAIEWRAGRAAGRWRLVVPEALTLGAKLIGTGVTRQRSRFGNSGEFR